MYTYMNIYAYQYLYEYVIHTEIITYLYLKFVS